MKLNNSSFLILLFFLFLSFLNSCKSMEGRPESIMLDANSLQDKDSVTLIATKRFKANLFKRIFQGKNYRKAWATPIKMPIAYLDTLEGGMRPLELGGGAQTLSMDLEGEDGIIYTLRSVNKNPSVMIPKVAKKLNMGNIVMDAMSAQHPYGAVLASALAKEAEVLSTRPKVIFLPHQKHLDTFDHVMGGKIFLLEYEPEGSGDWVNIKGTKKIIDTEDVREKLKEFPNSKIDERALVRARLFDMLIGDWDRHYKQWGWIVVKKENKITYVPLPTDRDNAFYNPRGVLPWLITRPFFQPQLRPYRKKIRHMKGLVKPFDQEFLRNVPETVFLEEAQFLKTTLTDEAIDEAMKSWPSVFVKNDGARIKKLIQARRKNLLKYAKKFRKEIVKKGIPKHEKERVVQEKEALTINFLKKN